MLLFTIIHSVLFLFNYVVGENSLRANFPPKLRVLSPNIPSSRWNYYKGQLRGADIAKGSTIHLVCEGSAQLAWIYPENIVVS